MNDDLNKALAELRRVTPPNSPWEAGDIGVGSSPVDYHIATVLNAVTSGDMLPRADADLAVALMVEPLLKLREWIEADIRSAHHGRGNGSSSAMREDDRDFRAAVAAAFDALVPASALAELQALRDERDAYKAASEAAHTDITTYLRIVADMTQEAEAAEARVAELEAALDPKFQKPCGGAEHEAKLRSKRFSVKLGSSTHTPEKHPFFTPDINGAWVPFREFEAVEAELATLRAQVERLTDKLALVHLALEKTDRPYVASAPAWKGVQK